MMLHSPFRLCLAVCIVAGLASPAFAQRGYDPNDPAGLIRRSNTIRKDLNVTKEQLKKIEEASKKAEDEYRKAMDAAREKYRKATKSVAMDVLTKKQKDRLWGIQVQLMGTSALYNEKVQEDIGLNRTQREKLANIKKKRDEARKLYYSSRKKEIRQKAMDMFKGVRQELDSTLSASQKQRLERLKGEPVFQRRQGGNKSKKGNL